MRWTELRDRWLRDPAFRKAYEEELPLVQLGARIAVRRRDLQLSQVELAHRAEVTQRQVSAIENGKTNATIATLTRIARVLQMDLQLTDRAVPAPRRSKRLPTALARRNPRGATPMSRARAK